MKKTRKKQTKIFYKIDDTFQENMLGREFLGKERRLQRMIQIRRDRIETNQSEIEEYTKELKQIRDTIKTILDKSQIKIILLKEKTRYRGKVWWWGDYRFFHLGQNHTIDEIKKNNKWNESELKDYLIDMGKRRFVELLIRDQKNNLKMYISKIEIIGMIFEIEKPNEDSFQI